LNVTRKNATIDLPLEKLPDALKASLYLACI